MSTQSYQDLDVWQRAMTLAEKDYAITALILKRDVWAFKPNQESSSSIPTNIAEIGQGF